MRASCIVILVLEVAVATLAQQSSLRYSISSGRNATGHRVVMVNLDSESPEVNGYSADPITLNMVHNVDLRDGVQKVHMVASTDIITDSSYDLPLQVSGSNRTVPLDYEVFCKVGYYKLHNAPATWDQAKRICESEHAHLILIDSAAELNVVKQLTARNPVIVGSTWGATVYAAGFSDQEKEGEFVTVLGEPFQIQSYNQWLSGAPHNEKSLPYNDDSDCGCFHTPSMLMDDAPCASLMAFICERPF